MKISLEQTLHVPVRHAAKRNHPGQIVLGGMRQFLPFGRCVARTVRFQELLFGRHLMMIRLGCQSFRKESAPATINSKSIYFESQLLLSLPNL